MTIKTIWVVFPISPHNIFFKIFIKNNKDTTMLQLTAKHKGKKKSLRNDLKRWNSHWIHRTHFRYTFKVLNIISHFNVSIISTLSSWRSASSWNTFSERNVTTSQLYILLITKFISIMNWNLPASKFHPLVTVICSGATYTQKTTLLVSWLHLGSLKHIFPKIFQETEYTQFLYSLL